LLVLAGAGIITILGYTRQALPCSLLDHRRIARLKDATALGDHDRTTQSSTMNTKRLVPARLSWIVASVMAILVVVIWFRCFLYWPPPITDIYLIRRAEKADASSDPPLSADGQVRAQALAHVLANTGIAAIYVTGFRRTQETAAPWRLPWDYTLSSIR
jgi:hypothetical protein